MLLTPFHPPDQGALWLALYPAQVQSQMLPCPHPHPLLSPAFHFEITAPACPFVMTYPGLPLAVSRCLRPCRSSPLFKLPVVDWQKQGFFFQNVELGFCNSAHWRAQGLSNVNWVSCCHLTSMQGLCSHSSPPAALSLNHAICLKNTLCISASDAHAYDS